MGLFKKKVQKKTYDHNTQKPVLRVSICTGETAAGFLDLETGRFEETMLIRKDADLETFKEIYDITGELEKTY